MAKPDTIALRGRLIHLIYSPKGGIEGVLLQASEGDIQLVLDKDDKASARQLLGVAGDSLVDAVVEKTPPPSKGPAPHPVFRLVRLGGSEGKSGKHKGARSAGTFNGKVARLNYARHGEPNGVVLDSGHFIHTKPDGMKQLGLTIGSQVEATGEARALVHGEGLVVEAHRVNGVEVRKGKPAAKKALKQIPSEPPRPVPRKAVKKVAKKAAKKAVRKAAGKTVKKVARKP